MAYGIETAIADLFVLAKNGQLTQAAVSEAAAQTGMTLPQFFNAVRQVRAPLHQMFSASGAPRQAMDVWKGIATLGRSTAATTEFAEAVTVASGLGGGGIVTSTLTSVGSAIAAKLGIAMTSTAAAALGAVAVTAALGVATVGVSRLAGSMSGDSSVKGGSAYDEAKLGRKWTGGASTADGGAPYYIMIADLSGGSILVGSESVIKNREACKFAGGGPCANPPVYANYKKVAGPFDSYEAAVAQWCVDQMDKPRHNHPVAGDSTIEIYGAKPWVGTAPSC